MRTCDVAVVGGGPAGAACAGALRAAGADVVVVDAAHFPRDKVCAGWVAPGVFAALDIDPGEYRASGHTLQPIRRITVTIEGEQGGTTIDYPDAVGYGVRRREFDTFLLRHCGAPAIEGTRVRQIRREGRGWRLDDTVSAGCLVGAGGQFCPVAAWLRSAASLRGAGTN
jgi:flavin-dependent dehydrogenase